MRFAALVLAAPAVVFAACSEYRNRKLVEKYPVSKEAAQALGLSREHGSS
jgi:hypothetical protein